MTQPRYVSAWVQALKHVQLLVAKVCTAKEIEKDVLVYLRWWYVGTCTSTVYTFVLQVCEIWTSCLLTLSCRSFLFLANLHIENIEWNVYG